MTLTIDVSPATARKLSAAPDVYETLLFVEDEAALDEAYLAIHNGRVHPFDPETARKKAKALLQAEL